jgi:hypothetical protein
VGTSVPEVTVEVALTPGRGREGLPEDVELGRNLRLSWEQGGEESGIAGARKREATFLDIQGGSEDRDGVGGWVGRASP